ncbi:efflux RND transporter periplasmic adaptor subunit [Burkholderia vietnamiensis]|uniref:efflux RND transporter periplasmic adaptor subunit n=1 Tax=Burkholderia vietnamiensis TaxID=60552 RepID=UPI001593AF23|nr:efflux RND transporter periplasmic adaptor subunit [Burkholderia vietnamiensis]
MMNTSTNNKPGRLRALFAWLGAALVVGALVWWVWPNEPAAPEAEPAMRVTAATAGPATLTPTLRLGGTLVAREGIAIGTALQDQRIAEVLVEVGQRVRRGQLLARLEIDSVQAQLREQEALAAEARSTLARMEPLARSGAISARALEEQRTRAATADANLAVARTQRGKAEVRAPVDGIVSARNARVGALAGTEPLFRLTGNDEIELEVDVPSADLPRLSAGMPAQVTVAGSGTAIEGKVRLVTPDVDPRSQTGKAHISFPSKSGLHAGVWAEARFALPARKFSVAVPVRSVAVGADGTAAVMLVSREGLVSRREVATGRRESGMLEIQSGLQAGDWVLLNAAAFVRDGDKVQVADTTEPGK